MSRREGEWRKDRLAIERIAAVGPLYELLVGRVVYDSISCRSSSAHRRAWKSMEGDGLVELLEKGRDDLARGP